MSVLADSRPVFAAGYLYGPEVTFKFQFTKAGCLRLIRARWVALEIDVTLMKHWVGIYSASVVGLQ
jgi:hypothetical protein